MNIKMALLYLRKNFNKTLALLMCVFLFSFLFLSVLSINKISTNLKEGLVSDLTYDIRLKNRLCKVDSGMVSQNDYDFNNEFQTIYKIFNDYDSHYDLYVKIQVGNEDVYYLYGSDSTYLEQHDIELVEGRVFVENSNEVLVNEGMLIGDRSVEIGDVISVPVAYKLSNRNRYFPLIDHYIDYEVVGLYKSRNIDITNYENEYMLNNRIYLSRENVLDYYDDYISLFKDHNIKTVVNNNNYVLNIKFVDAYITLSSYDEMEDVYTDVKNKLSSINGKISPLGDKYEIESNTEYVDSIISPFVMLTDNVKNVFGIMYLVFLLIIALFIMIEINSRTREFGIKNVLGLKDTDNIKTFVIEKLMIIASGICLAYIVYLLSFNSIISSYINKKVNLENDILNLIGVKHQFILNNINHSYLISPRYFIIYMLVTITVCVLLVVLLFKVNKPKNVKDCLLH